MMHRLLLLMKWGVGLVVARSFIGCFDPREFYVYGQFGAFVWGCASTALAVWLYKSVKNGRSWARKSYLVYAGLEAAGFLIGLGTLFSSGIVTIVLSVGSTVIEVYCAYLFLSPEVAAFFGPDSKSAGRRAALNQQQCIGFWAVFGAAVIAFVTIAFANYQTDAWCEDCLQAAVAGSSEARDELIAYRAEINAQNGYDDPEYWATSSVERDIEAKTPRKKEMAGKEMTWKDWHGCLKGIAFLVFILGGVADWFFSRKDDNGQTGGEG